MDTGDDKVPMRYVGQPKTIDQTFHDGQLRPAIGTHSYQVLRANRTNPPDSDQLGYTYNHAPMMAFHLLIWPVLKWSFSLTMSKTHR